MRQQSPWAAHAQLERRGNVPTHQPPPTLSSGSLSCTGMGRYGKVGCSDGPRQVHSMPTEGGERAEEGSGSSHLACGCCLPILPLALPLPLNQTPSMRPTRAPSKDRLALMRQPPPGRHSHTPPHDVMRALLHSTAAGRGMVGMRKACVRAGGVAGTEQRLYTGGRQHLVSRQARSCSRTGKGPAQPPAVQAASHAQPVPATTCQPPSAPHRSKHPALH